MLILAFDTSGPACSVVLWRDGAVITGAQETMDRGQAEALMPMVARVMSEANVSYDALDRIAVTVGPGSFTGVRVALAAARGLSLASGKPSVGILSGEVLAAAVPAAERARAACILAAIDTKRGDLYVQQFSPDGAPLTAPLALAPAALPAWVTAGSVIVVGDGAVTAQQALGGRAAISAAAPLVDAGILAALAAQHAPAPEGPLPVYVLPPSITASA